jgi:RNA polymerase sigma factor (sigma-70 family)
MTPLTPPTPGKPAASDWPQRSHELAQLLQRAALGDRAAFARLYELTSGHLFAVVLRIQRDRALAEDLLQEIYVNLWRAAGSFDAAQSQPLTWMTSIARHRAIDSLRRAQAQPRTVSATRDEDDDGPDPAEALPDAAAGPLELLSQASEARQLAHCMQDLSAQQRQSVALAFYDGLSHAEVAEHLRQPLGTVKSWLRRALMSLKNCLDRAAARDAATVSGGA